MPGGLGVGKISDHVPRKLVVTVATGAYSCALVLSWMIKTGNGPLWMCYVAGALLGLGEYNVTDTCISPQSLIVILQVIALSIRRSTPRSEPFFLDLTPFPPSRSSSSSKTLA